MPAGEGADGPTARTTVTDAPRPPLAPPPSGPQDRDVTLTRAAAKAQGIAIEFEKEAATYAGIMRKLGLDAAGLLAYVSTRALEANTNSLDVALDAPAKASYETDL